MKKIFILSIFLTLNICGDEKLSNPPAPWLTGPLIAPSEYAIPLGQIEFESYIYATTTTGAYSNKWKTVSADHNFFSLNPQFFLYFGLTPWMDLNIIPQFFYQTTQNQNSINFGDLIIALDFQLLDPNYTPYFPGIKFTFRETFPTGPYQKLNPRKLLTDLTGAGTFGTNLNLVLYKVYHLTGKHFFSAIYSAAYTLTTPVRVHGLNAYGGGTGANGKAYPGETFQAIISFELTLTQNLVLALDNVYTHTNRTTFTGNPGKTSNGLPAKNSEPSSEQITFAPAIEYNFSSTLGIIAGCWFTAYGRNTPDFKSFVFNIIYTF